MVAIDDTRPTTLQVSAIGGEGGGVLATWIVAAAQRAGYPVQSTSIPGVAQRTGATVYYIEVFPVPIAELGGKRPVMALYPGVGDIDIMLASEFAEAGRAISNGFVTPDRTHLIASTHRVYAIGERSDMADGRYDVERLFEAARERTKHAYLADLRRVAEANGVSLNAVLFGVLAGIGQLPVSVADYKGAIEESGIAVGPNIKGFEIGLNYSFSDEPEKAGPIMERKGTGPTTPEALTHRLHTEFPEPCHTILREGVTRLIGYQDVAYASAYLDRLSGVFIAETKAGGDGAVTAEAGRQLALRMSYEDVIRVAQLKSESDRLSRIREEVGAKDDEPIVVVDYLKPGIDELCSVLPAGIGRRLMSRAERQGWRDRSNFGLQLKSTTVTGYIRLRLLASLRRWRRGTYRYSEEQASIEAWLEDVKTTLSLSRSLAMETVECARLIKGYGETHRRGSENFKAIRDQVIAPAMSGAMAVDMASDAVANARAAALSDPEGTRLEDVLAEISKTSKGNGAE
ncbi:MAG: indolepyruvate oxidoreductase subunit beta family protein [Alphaproteobacteria bacterium]